MRPTESFTLAQNVSGNYTGALNQAIVNPDAPSNPLPGTEVDGGRYMVLASGTLGTTPAVQIADAFGTWYTVTNALAAGSPQIVEIPPGLARVNLTAAANAFVTLSRIPGE